MCIIVDVTVVMVVDGFAAFIDHMGSAYARGEIGESRCEMHCGEEDCQKNELVMMSMEL